MTAIPEKYTIFRNRLVPRAVNLMAGAGLAVLCGMGVAGADAPTPAPEVSPMALEVFEPEYFARYAPRNALDMISQTPGFEIRESEARRGLGQGGANVLINSRRLSSKSTDARDALRRISADRVVRIEILEGASLNISGLSGQVANIITREGGTTGNWAWNPEFREDRQPKLENARLSVSGQLGDAGYTLSLESRDFGGGSAGPEQVIAPDGSLLETRIEDQEFGGVRREVSLELTHESLSGAIANANFAGSFAEFEGREISYRSGVLAPGNIRLFRDANDEASGEIGGDYQFGLGIGRLKLIGLHRVETGEPGSETLTDYFGALQPAGSRYSTDREKGESILRAEYGWSNADKTDWQVSAEGAFNYLDTASQYAVLSNSAFSNVALSNATSRVEEKRGEAAIVHGRELADALVLQTSLGAEFSQLTQSGANGKSREFIRPKGYASLSWQPIDDWDIAFRIERAIGQLDFDDFISSVNLNNETGQQTSGNPEIVPEQSWDIDLEAKHDLGALGALRLRAYARAIEDVNDSVLFARTVAADGSITIDEGPGNLDSATVYGIEAAGTFELAETGLEGAKVDWDLGVSDSAVDDPLTGETRPLSRSDRYRYSIRFRHDVPDTAWAWGFGYGEGRSADFYRITQRNQRFDRPGGLGVFVQNKDVIGLNTRLSLQNLLDQEEVFNRIAYVGTRADPVDFTEQRVRNSGLEVRLSLSGSF